MFSVYHREGYRASIKSEVEEFMFDEGSGIPSLGTRDFLCAFSGCCQVLIVTPAKICRPPANTEASICTQGNLVEIQIALVILISPGAIIKRTVVLVASLRSLNCGFRFSLRFSARNAHFSYPRMMVSLTAEREEIKNETDEKKKET